MKRSSVSRSVYQKVCEENKRLKSDIWGLVNHIEPIRKKWQEIFRKESEDRKLIYEAVKRYMEGNPNDPAVKFVKSLKGKYPKR